MLKLQEIQRKTCLSSFFWPMFLLFGIFKPFYDGINALNVITKKQTPVTTL